MAMKVAEPELDVEAEVVEPRRQPPYRVVLLNDDVHTFRYVTEMLVKVCRHTVDRAEELTRAVDKQGQAIVWVGAREVAELKADQLEHHGPDVYMLPPTQEPMRVRVEPAE